MNCLDDISKLRQTEKELQDTWDEVWESVVEVEHEIDILWGEREILELESLELDEAETYS